jgi:transcriptional regulator with XRE-family HTH domain
MACMNTLHSIGEVQQARVLGARLAQVRIRKQLTQQQLADLAGLGLRTVQRLEIGEVSTQLVGFLKVCRVLGLSGRLDALIPEQSESPLERLRQQEAPRRRVRLAKPSASAVAWSWGDTR